MRFFTKTNIQMLALSFVGVVIMLVMSLYVSASMKSQTREPASVTNETEQALNP